MKLAPRKIATTSALCLLGTTVFLSLPAASSAIEGCGESGACSQLRQDTYAQLHQCIFVAGNPKDCTGVLTCEFAVNRKFRPDAELTVASIGEQSQGCYLCAVPNCITAGDPYCEPVTRECIVVSGFTSSGSPIGTSEDSGVSLPIEDASSGLPPTD
jgi:hypothetical protein